MSDAVLFLSLAISFFSVLLIGLLVYKGLFKKKDDTDAEVAAPADARPPPVRAGGDQGPRVVRNRRNVAARMRAGVAAARPEAESEDEDLDTLGDEIALPDGKIGAKKRKKLEMKAEKRAAREREVEEREERKQRQEQQEEMRRREEEKVKQEEAMKEEEEKRLKEEKEKQELEEYLKMKEAFAVEEEGYDENENENEAQNKFQEFINYINTEKVVLLEELAAHFKLKTQECIDRVQALLEQEQLVGVIDDRGKFISISNEELQSVAKFIRQRGRVLISELVDNSNELIKLQTKESVTT